MASQRLWCSNCTLFMDCYVNVESRIIFIYLLTYLFFIILCYRMVQDWGFASGGELHITQCRGECHWPGEGQCCWEVQECRGCPVISHTTRTTTNHSGHCTHSQYAPCGTHPTHPGCSLCWGTHERLAGFLWGICLLVTSPHSPGWVHRVHDKHLLHIYSEHCV